ncbi:MAG: DUF1295 domain-containing protein [Bacteroidota bacterium]
MPNVYLEGLILILIYMIGWFVAANLSKNNSIVDIAWGSGFVLIAGWMQYFHPFEGQFILTTIVTIWGLRLAVYIFYRNMGKPEDWRYVELRKSWGKTVVIQSFIKVFLFQGFLLWVIALPLIPSQGIPLQSGPLLYFGLFLWFFGFSWEAIADWQLLKFKCDRVNQGKIMTKGLWSYSRHPNYFGEIVLWWGIFFVALPLGPWYILIISPLTITFLLIKVSGVPLLESKYKDNPEYQEYKRKTSALIPGL